MVADLELEFNKLKLEIKEWEHNFTMTNNGAKPSLKDIKLNSEIQAKYKQYNKLKKRIAALSAQSPAVADSQGVVSVGKQEQDNNGFKTPTKRLKNGYDKVMISSPSNHKKRSPLRKADPVIDKSGEQNDYESPNSIKSSPFKIKELGPTPQLNGRVLSIFDIPLNSPVVTPVKRQKGTMSPSKILEDQEEFQQGSVNSSSDDEADIQKLINKENRAKTEPEPIFKTPMKKRQQIEFIKTPIKYSNSKSPLKKKFMETPLYLRKDVGHVDGNVTTDFWKSSPNSKDLKNHHITLSKTPSPNSNSNSNLNLNSNSDLKRKSNVSSNNSVLLDVGSSPIFSPQSRFSKRKSLYEMINELDQIQTEITNIDDVEDEDIKKLIMRENELLIRKKNDAKMAENDDEWNILVEQEAAAGKQDEMNAKNTEESSNAIQNSKQDETLHVHKKAKTQKRQTRRVKLHSRTGIIANQQKDDYAEVNIHERLKEMRQDDIDQMTADAEDIEDEKDLDVLNNLEDDLSSGSSSYTSSSSSSEDDEKDDEEVVLRSKAKDINEKKEKFKPLNTNFVRMKIHYKNRGKFRKRR
ncbi:hypothetical protein PACTADRAFT_4046 [Pachysolen tannophilus NRRL Y-2460]|uniref:DNA replication regulator SLD2 n=1 Tax=Pachysolen tannophilus NRRL Y-2460 TaxID=669874 RepID=A0A1E4TQP2_PACTA|nr:hypothetical protein PACTADRAFT_4046 [Pachysolen tannophilus NRRL Y-2460]